MDMWILSSLRRASGSSVFLNQRPLSSAFLHQALLFDLYIQTYRELGTLGWPSLLMMASKRSAKSHTMINRADAPEAAENHGSEPSLNRNHKDKGRMDKFTRTAPNQTIPGAPPIAPRNNGRLRIPRPKSKTQIIPVTHPVMPASQRK
jgi:hypothetical protein